MKRTLLLLAAGWLGVVALPAQNQPATKTTNAPGALPAPLTNRPPRFPTARPDTNAPATTVTNRPGAIPPRAAPGTLPAPTVQPAAPAVPTATTGAGQTAPPVNPPAPGQVAGGAAGGAPADTGKDSEGVKFSYKGIELEQFLDDYAELVGRTLLRHPQVPLQTKISLKTQNDLTKDEAIQAMDTVLAMNNITIVKLGDKFMTVVPSNEALREAARFNTNDAAFLPDAAQYVTKVLQITNAKPSEVVQALTPFSKMPGGLLALDSTGILIIRDYAVNMKRMLELVEKIDVSIPVEEDMEVIPIKYSPVDEVAAVLGSLTSGGAAASTAGATRPTRRTGATGTPGTPGYSPTGTVTPFGAQPGQPGVAGQTPGLTPGSAASDFQRRLQQIVGRAAQGGTTPLLGEARIIPYPRNNSILVIANKTDMAMVKKLVDQIDVPLQQVLIEAIIMEVSLDNTRSLGVSAAQKSTVIGTNNTGFGGFNNTPFASLTTNAFPGNIASGGFSYFGFLEGDKWQFALKAIASDNTVNVLSRPRIQTSHAEPAFLFIGDTVPYITGTYFGGVGGTASSQYQQKSVGITLQVTPLITPDGLVVLDMQQMNIQQLGTPITIDNNPVPTTTERNASSKVAVKDGETIMLGGFISSTKSKSNSGVPGLKDIPWLGALFRSKSDETKRVELIVLIRPTVLKDSAAAAVLAERERQSLPGVSAAEKEIRDDEARRRKKLDDDMAREMEAAPKKNPPLLTPKQLEQQQPQQP